LAGGADRFVGVDLGVDMNRVGPLLDPFDADLAQVTRQHTDRLLILHRDIIPIDSLGVKHCCSTHLSGQPPLSLFFNLRGRRWLILSLVDFGVSVLDVERPPSD